MSTIATTDICDDHGEAARVVDDLFAVSLGKRSSFHGPAKTLRTFEDNTKVREAVESDGKGQVLVVDGGGSRRCALFGGNLAVLAAKNNWAGIIIYGCARDADEIDAEDIGLKAIGLCPRKSAKQNLGSYDVAVTFGGQTIQPGDYIYADRDGVVVASGPLHS